MPLAAARSLRSTPAPLSHASSNLWVSHGRDEQGEASSLGPCLRTNDRQRSEARSPPGDQAPDLHFLVAGAGFEPATSGL